MMLAMCDTIKSAWEGALRGAEIMKRIGWVSLGVSLAAVGVFAARELRDRWAFSRRSPYDFYSHAGDDFEMAEAGMGV
jgi:hypothetical protein